MLDAFKEMLASFPLWLTVIICLAAFCTFWFGMWFISDRSRRNAPRKMTVMIVDKLHRQTKITPIGDYLPLKLPRPRTTGTSAYPAMSYCASVEGPDGFMMTVLVDRHTFDRLEVGEFALLIYRRSMWRHKIEPYSLIPKMDS